MVRVSVEAPLHSRFGSGTLSLLRPEREPRESRTEDGQLERTRSDHAIGRPRAAHSRNTRVGSRASAGYTPGPGVALSPISAVPIAAPTAPRYEAAVVERSEEHTSELQSLTNLVCR